MNAYLICSGGLDSVTLAYHLKARNALGAIISFNYGQKHSKEMQYAKLCAQKLSVPFHLIDISNIGKALIGSALTDNIAVPDGHYSEETMKVTVVPNRNAVFLTIAYAIAAANKADHVALAVHGGDHFIYPDCRPNFISAFDAMEKLSLDNAVSLYAPYVDKNKTAIVRDGNENGVPFIETWSCYKGGEKHCGRCGTCVERREAFFLAEVVDPTDYEDEDFWQETLKKHQERG